MRILKYFKERFKKVLLLLLLLLLFLKNYYLCSWNMLFTYLLYEGV